MCCDCLDPKPTEEEEEEEEEEESVCDDEQRSYGDRGAPAPESDDEEEVGECSNCDAPLDDDEHIFIFTRGDEEKTMCQMCGEDLHEELNADGWRRDDDEWNCCVCENCDKSIPDEDEKSKSLWIKTGDLVCGACLKKWSEEKTEKPKPTCDDCGRAIRDTENLDTCWTNDGIIFWCEYCREEHVEEYIRERDGED